MIRKSCRDLLKNTARYYRDAGSDWTSINDPRVLKNGQEFALQFVIYKLETWVIHTGLETQISSTIITNYLRSPVETNLEQISFIGAQKL